ncbi:helix-turn-helix domain-containing protein [Streptomyces nigra]|jgi:transcriptional regulator with XRE-family HTH domain|uniref:helix-turn-helix domain-containing protein n=1 Tax=Streptomyces TaxID=1883 RepID=UPI0006E314B5|nr:helix-turn-helix transcriptional regulator [Streptomyces sp. JHA19]
MTGPRDADISESAEYQLEFADLPHLLRAWRAEAGVKLGRGKALPQKEVALRMGVSERWYRALESGAQVPLTSDTLTQLADALVLGPDERTALYSYRLAEVSDERQPTDDIRRYGRLKEFVDAQTMFPAYLIDHAWNVIAYNALMARWFPWVREPEANLMRWVLLNPDSRVQLVDWRKQASLYLAQLRFALFRNPDDPTLQDLLTGVRREPICQELWDAGPRIIAFRQGGRFRLELPHVSPTELVVTAQVLLPAYLPGARFVTLMPA